MDEVQRIKPILQLEKYKTLENTLKKRETNTPEDYETENISANRIALPTHVSQDEEIFCRICYSYESPLGLLNDLVSPCGCKGTIKYVHRYCLRIWRFKGKMVKDIKVCEQCFCEYVVDDEKQVGKIIVAVSTAAIMISLLVLTSIFISSSADTAKFILNDIYTYMYGNSKMVSFDDPILVCNMDSIIARKNSENPLRSTFVLKKIEGTASGEHEHFASIKKKYIYSLKNIHLLDVEKSDLFLTCTTLGVTYTILCEDNPILFINFMLSFWRIISFDTLFDWALYGMINLYIYTQMFEKIYKCIDNYCMYAINVY